MARVRRAWHHAGAALSRFGRWYYEAWVLQAVIAVAYFAVAGFCAARGQAWWVLFYAGTSQVWVFNAWMAHQQRRRRERREASEQLLAELARAVGR